MAKKWPRDRYTGPGGGLYKVRAGAWTPTTVGADAYSGGGLDHYNGGGLDHYNGGGLDNSPGGGLYNGPGGGLYSGPCDHPFMASTPPTQVFVKEQRARGSNAEADEIARAHGIK